MIVRRYAKSPTVVRAGGRGIRNCSRMEWYLTCVLVRMLKRDYVGVRPRAFTLPSVFE